MTDSYANGLETGNYIFTLIFNFECLIKIMGVGKNYFSSAWNKYKFLNLYKIFRFDFLIVVGTDFGILFSVFLTSIRVSAVTSIMRTFRIMRIFRLVIILIFNPQYR